MSWSTEQRSYLRLELLQAGFTPERVDVLAPEELFDLFEALYVRWIIWLSQLGESPLDAIDSIRASLAEEPLTTANAGTRSADQESLDAMIATYGGPVNRKAGDS